MKYLKGEKYIYALMAIMLAKQPRNGKKEYITIGRDEGMKGQQHRCREFRILKHGDKTFLVERKSSANFADFTRAYEFVEYPSGQVSIMEPTGWEH